MTSMSRTAAQTSTRTGRASRWTALGASSAVAALLLAGCGGADTTDSTPQTPAATASPTAGAAAAEGDAALTVIDPWAKATDEHMTGVFGTLVNESDQPLHLVGAEAEIAGTAELHETAEDGTGSTLMQEKEGGFVIEPGQSLELVPGGDHVMLMQLTEEIEPGQEVLVTLEFADGSTAPLEAVAKEFAGANEVYESDETEDEHGDHEDHDGH